MSSKVLKAKPPKVSVITPLYNKAKYIGQTLESVLAQTFQDWELVVVDNSSTDEGPALVGSCRDPRIALHSCSRKGVSAARNLGLSHARGEWLVFLDADDLLAPGYLASQLDVAARDVDVDLVVCCYEEFRDGSEGQKVTRCPSPEHLADTSIVYCAGPQHIFFAKRRLLAADIRWPEHLDRLLGEDTCFWFQVLTRARVAFNPQPMARYRIWTPGSRFTNLSHPELLFTGIGEAVKTNLAFLSSIRRELSAGQAEMLFRFNYGIYLTARTADKRVVAAEALAEARRWMNRYFAIVARPSWAMILRRLLGLPLFAAVFGRK